MPARSLADALADSPAGPLLARAARVQRISRSLAAAAAQLSPDLDVQDPGVCELREGVLLLNARSPAQAAKLRQGIPGLLRILHQQGAQVTEIRVRVQPARTSYPERANDPSQVSPRAQITTHADPVDPQRAIVPTAVAGADGAEALAQALVRNLPDSLLRRAAERLQASLRRGGRADSAGRAHLVPTLDEPLQQQDSEEQQARRNGKLEQQARPAQVAALSGDQIGGNADKNGDREQQQ